MTPEQFIGMLEAAPQRLASANMRGPLEQGARGVNRAVEGNFQRQEDGDGSPWPPHSPVTIRKHGPHPLLRLTYDMFRAATNFDDANAYRQFEERSVTFGVDGTEIPYVRFQQSGTSKIPAREFFYLREADEPRVADAIADGLQPIIENEVLR